MSLHYKLSQIIIIPLTVWCLSSSALPLIAFPNINEKNQTQQIENFIPGYQKIANQPWNIITLKKVIKPGMHDPNIILIRQRLIILKDLPNYLPTNSQLYDATLVQGVKRFQQRYGFNADGVIGPLTIDALNVSPAQLLQKLTVNQQRWAIFSNTLGNNYIWINIPSYDLKVINNGVSVVKMRVIVGKVDRRTPELYSNVDTIVLNPTWNIPPSILKKDVIPQIIKDRSYLSKNKIQIYANWQAHAPQINPQQINWEQLKTLDTIPYRFTQSPSAGNSLGLVKFIFQNKEAIYLHDTPHKELFQAEKRAFSSGCIRLSEPFKLVQYFIDKDPQLNNTLVQQHLTSMQTKYLRIAQPIPLYISYITAWVDSAGVLQLRDDIYHKD